MTPLSSRLKSCQNSLSKSGSKSSTTSTISSISSNLTKWSSLPWMVSPHDQKWTIKDPEDLKVPETTNNLSSDFTDTTSKVQTVNKTSKTIQSLQVQNSCKNLMKWFTFSFRKKLKKTITGKMLASFSQDLTAREKASTRSCNGSEQIRTNFRSMIVTVFMDPTLISSC